MKGITLHFLFLHLQPCAIFSDTVQNDKMRQCEKDKRYAFIFQEERQKKLSLIASISEVFFLHQTVC